MHAKRNARKSVAMSFVLSLYKSSRTWKHKKIEVEVLIRTGIVYYMYHRINFMYIYRVGLYNDAISKGMCTTHTNYMQYSSESLIVAKCSVYLC